ncbi:Nicotianamine synthase [Parasitella parasitica]|nr:Nicotianamine synthase [Parasitella parasitica]
MVHHSSCSIATEAEAFCNDHAAQKMTSSSVSSLINEICHIHHQLSNFDCLIPGDHVNSLFTKLVTICTFQYDNETVKAVLRDSHIVTITPTLRAMASQGEYFLELGWANKLCRDQHPKLSKFVYYQNYVDLVKLEISALHGVDATLDNIVFIGSGPLPLSPILMYQELTSTFPDAQVMIYNIDRDEESIIVSNALLQKLGIANGFKQHIMDAADYSANHADLVVLGALVGRDLQEKMDYLAQIGNSMRSGSHLMVRSAHSLRKLLYPSIEPWQVNACGFETVVVLHPFNDVVNSVLIAKKR